MPVTWVTGPLSVDALVQGVYEGSGLDCLALNVSDNLRTVCQTR